MQDNFIFDIIGTQQLDENTTDKVEMTVVGSFVYKNGSYYIMYEEIDEDTDEKVKTIIKIKQNQTVNITRGKYSRLVLEKGQRHLCCYSTPAGDLHLGVFTERIYSDLTKKGGELEFKYSLDVDNNLQSINQVFMKIREANKNV